MGKNNRRRAEPQRPFVSPARPSPGRQAKPEKLDESLVAIEAADSAQFVGFRTPIPAIHHLARTVAALPLHQFMPLNQAYVKAKDRLGSGDLAAHDLWEHALGRRLTVAARRILPDGTEQAFILRSAFWQYFTILSVRADLDPHLDTARVQGDNPLTGWLSGPSRWWPGHWYFFVGCRRFDRLHSAATPSVKPKLTEDQIQALMGDVSELTDTEKKLRRYVVMKYSDRWGDVLPTHAMEAAKHDPLYEKEVGVAGWGISTWRRALGRKDVRKK